MLGNGRGVDQVLAAHPELVRDDGAQAIHFAGQIIELCVLLRIDEAFAT